MNEIRWGQQKDGSLVFPVRIRGLPASPTSPREVALVVLQLLEPELWRTYGPLCSVSIAEDVVARQRERPSEEGE